MIAEELDAIGTKSSTAGTEIPAGAGSGSDARTANFVCLASRAELRCAQLWLPLNASYLLAVFRARKTAAAAILGGVLCG